MTRGEEFFVYRAGPEAAELMARYDHANSLYGTAAKVEFDGTILIPQWVSVEQGTVSPDEFTKLSGSRYSDEALFRMGLRTKDVWEMQIHEVKKNGGSVETAIRMAGKIITGQKDVEQKQLDVVLGRVRYLRDYFQEHELSSIPEERRAAFQEETIALLADVGLEPDRVKLPVKLLMLLWTVKMSRGEDSWGRINKLVADQYADAVERRGIEREQETVGNIVVKYTQIGAGLFFARSLDRRILAEVGDETEQRLLRNVYLQSPQAPIRKDIGYTVGKIGSLSWLLGKTKVRPYRPIAIEMKSALDWIGELLERHRQEELFGLGLPDRLRVLVQGCRNILNGHADIYSKDS